MSTAAQSIREIVTSRPSAASIFHRFDIDLCVQADLSLEAACRELQLSVDQVLEKLADAELKERGDLAFDPLEVSLGRLIQHIVRVHHHGVRQVLPALCSRGTFNDFQRHPIASFMRPRHTDWNAALSGSITHHFRPN